MDCAVSMPKDTNDGRRPPPAPKSRAPCEAAPLTEDEKLLAGAIDGGIDFDGADCHWPDVRTRKSGMLSRSSALAATRNMPSFCRGLPKAELHVHIEGTLTPHRAYAIAERNGLPNLDDFDPAQGALARSRSRSPGAIEYCPGEHALNAFLTEYNRCSTVLRTEEDFHDVMTDYLTRAAADGVRRAEIFFDPQTHCFTDTSGAGADPAARDPRGVGEPRLPFKEVVLDGLWRGIEEARETLGIDAALIMCFLQDRSTEEADAMLDLALPHRDRILGVGQDNGTGPFGPGSTSRFRPVYEKARANGLRLVCHAGEEEGAESVRTALDILGVERVDHGIRSLEDPDLVARLARDAVPLTLCPLSYLRLQLQPRFFCGECPVRPLLEAGVRITINSDDPAYFSLGAVDGRCRAVHGGNSGNGCGATSYDGFVASNYLWAARTCGLTPDECAIVARNSFEACFVSEEEKAGYVEELREYCEDWEPPASV